MNIRKLAYSLVIAILSYCYPRNSIGINRWGYSGCSGLEKLRYRTSAKSIAACRMQLQKKNAWWAAMCYAGLHLKVCSKLGSGAKPATPCLARIGSTAKSIAACRMQLQKKLHGGLRAAMWHAGSVAKAPSTPLPDKGAVP